MPWTDTTSPLMAPAVLKSALKAEGILSATVDLNAEIRQWLLPQEHRDLIIRFMLSGQIDARCRPQVKGLIDMMADRLLAFDTPWIALSLLTYISQIPTRWLCMRLKQRCPGIRIVIGGPGAFISLKSKDTFADSLLKLGLIDHYISGDGEISLAKLLLGNRDYPGIDSRDWQQIENLDALPFPNFDDYNWHLYDNKQISIVGSRGCVRKCTFCDIHEHWSQYQWRSAQSLFDEMHLQCQRHDIRIFRFSDSLVNGNQKEFRKLIGMLAEFNSNRTDREKIKWTGSFIIRPLDQMKESDWQLTAASGAAMLSVGVESFVENIRYHIGKKFSNVDLDFALEMAQKYSIKLSILLIVGYVTETEQDFAQALDWVRSHGHLASDPVYTVQIGSGLGILPNTWLDRHKEAEGVQLGSNQIFQDWISIRNGSTPKRRMEWHHLMKTCLEENGFDAAFHKDNHVLIESYLNTKYD